jgi:hypothetical protein
MPFADRGFPLYLTPDKDQRPPRLNEKILQRCFVWRCYLGNPANHFNTDCDSSIR